MAKTSSQSGPSLRAVLFADAVQYSRLVAENEQATLRLMRRCFQLFEELSPTYAGRFVKTTGDGALIDFDSSISAVEFALAAQAELVRLNDSIPPSRKAWFRMGIHLGEVMYEEGDLYGHIVNVAARLEGYAQPGGICISQTVYEQARHKLFLSYRSLGPKRLKNIAEPIIAYEILSPVASDEAEPEQLTFPSASITVLDHFSLSDSAGNLIGLRSSHACALLGYLALCQRFTETRNRLAGMLWSESTPQQARKALQSCIGLVKKALASIGDDLLITEREVIQLVQTRVKIDLISAWDRLNSGEVSSQLLEANATPDKILQGLEPVDRAFESWLHVARHVWRDRLIDALEANLARAGDQPAEGKKAALALLNIDSTHEKACRCLMESHAAAGNVSASLRVYNDLCAVLKKEFDAEPAEETRALAARIRSGGQKHMPSEPADELRVGIDEVRADSRLPIIEVSSFLSNHVGSSKQYLLEGFRRELLTGLVRFRDWVIVESHRDTVNPVGSAIPPDYRVEFHGDEGQTNLHLTVTLSELRHNRLIWGERYPLALENWLTTQREIVRQVAASLNIYLSAERISSQSALTDISLEAYDDWLRGEEVGSKWTAENYETAERLFKSVIARMPRFAPGYSSLADIYNTWHLALPGKPRSPERQTRAHELAQQAVKIDPLNTRAHLTLAWSCAMMERFDQAVLHYNLAYDLNPNNPHTVFSCAQGLAFAGSPEQASQLAQQALLMTPVPAQYQWAYLAATRFVCGDYAGCVEAAHHGGDAIIDLTGWSTAALSMLDRTDEARSVGKQFIEKVRACWTSEEQPTSEAIVSWFLHSIPMNKRDDLRRLNDGLRAAGVSAYSSNTQNISTSRTIA